MRIYDKLYPQIKTPARKIHDEQCLRKLHNSSGTQRFVYVLWYTSFVFIIEIKLSKKDFVIK